MIKKLMKHGTLFIFAKSMVLIAPLFAAYLLDRASYGLVEWSLSIAMVISTMITIGAGNTIAFEKVKNEASPLIYIGQTYSLYLGIVIAGTGVFSYFFFNAIHLSMVLGMSAFLVIQYALSAYMKASGLGARASVVDSGIYIVLLVLLLFTWAQETRELSYVIIFSIFALLLAILLNRSRTTTKITQVEIKKFIIRGFPIMLSGGMAILFFNLPKVLLGTTSMEVVGEFSLYFRWAALALVVYQFIVVVFFRDLYTKSYQSFDKFIALISIGIYILGFIILLFLYLLNIYEVQYLPLPKFNLKIEVLMVGIVALWALTASLEGMMYRENKSLHQFFSNVFGSIVFLVTFYTLYHKEEVIYSMSFSWLISFMAIIIYQLVMIHRDILKSKFIYINLFFVLTCSITIFLSEIIL